MEILRTQHDGYLEMSFAGRLDSYWAGHLTESAGQTMREGTHALRLNLANATYISSAGIAALVGIYKEFSAVNGSFAVVEVSRAVQQIVEMVGLGPVLLGSSAPPAPPPPEGLQVFDCVAGAELTCRVFGDPGLLARASFGEGDASHLNPGEDSIALGLGALGEGFTHCRERFGEFLSVAGAAAYQPTDGTNAPDYMVSSGSFVPQITALYGLCCQGPLAALVRFEDASQLSRLVERALEIAGRTTAAIVILAESAGLSGASLKRSPVSGGALFGHPEIQTWVSFSPEPCYTRNLVLLAGVASAAPCNALRPFLRPISRASAVSAHFHAAAFGYRPLPKGRLDLRAAVKGLFDGAGLQAVLHVLADDREGGATESELLRGACWVGPVGRVIV
jgi:anti-anti-sigma factor